MIVRSATGCLAVVIAFSAGTVHAAAPDLGAGQKVYDGNALIAVADGHATPEVTDWNEDGRLDLLVGQYGNGYINLFLNLSSNSIPLFDGSSFIQSSGTPIAADYG